MSASPPPSTDAPAPLVFISYSRQDAKWRERLLKYLAPAKSTLSFDVWDDSRLMAGQEWGEEINNTISRARVAVLLVSPNYLDSEWLINVEVPALLERFRGGGLRLFPILLEPCAWKNVPWLSQIQLFPTDAKPINGRARSTQDRLFTEAAEQIIRFATSPDLSPRKTNVTPEVKAAPPPAVTASVVDERPAAADEVVSSISPGGRPTVDALGELQMAAETEDILRLARTLALFAEDEPMRVTSSCLLFAIAEAGGERYPLIGTSTSAFLRKELSVNAGRDYEKTLALKFPRLPSTTPWYDSTTAVADLLTENVPHIFKLAAEISLRTYKPSLTDAALQSSDEPLSAGEVGARHLLAALLVFKPGLGQSGAVRRLRTIRPDEAALRRSFYEFIVSTWPADNAEAWRATLLPEEAPGSGVEEGAGEEGQGEAAPGEFRAPLAGFLTDYWDGNDLLGITPDVNALASLVAAWSVEPPLSIGLFGDWGSGKSHFMRQMKARVEKLSRRARRSPEPQNKVGYYKHIVQIEFNAWHYIEGNLWASLVEHIFEHLKLSDKEHVSFAEERRRVLMKELGITQEIQAKAEQRKQELEAKGRAARERAEDAKSARSERARDLALLRDELKTEVLDKLVLPVKFDEGQKALLSELGIPEQSLTSASKVHEQYLEARSLWGRARAQWTLFRRDPNYVRRHAVALAVLLVPLAVGLGLPLVYEGLRNQRLDSVWAYVASAFTFILTLWRGARPYLRKFREGLTLLRKKEAEIAAERDKLVTELQKDVDVLTEQYHEAEREAETIKGQVKRLEEEIAGTNSGRILADFIEDRAACNDYRRHLGVLALIRRDFEKLADLFRQQRLEELAGQTRPDGNTINRIILYIDDLDRCPPDRVVQVLQAIHLLLAFPLFVVVVGVDARWVTRSLQESYEWLRGEAEGDNGDAPATPGEPRAATPHDYLEKIFQIPFWLNPLEDTACKNFLDGLTKDSLEDAGRNGGGPPPVEGRAGAEANTQSAATTPGGEAPAAVGAEVEDPGETTDDDERGDASDAPPDAPENVTGGGRGGPAGGVETAAGAKEEDPEEDDAEEIDLEPRSLKLTSEEVGYMKELTPLVGRSPRSVKRFLNCYRLIKVGLPPEQLKRFVEGDGRGGEFRAVMILLAIITGAPSVSIYVIEELEEQRRRGRRDATLHGFLESVARRPELGSRPEWGRVRKFLEEHVAQERSGDVFGSLLNVVPRVARYSFRVAKFEPAAGQPRAEAPPKARASRPRRPTAREPAGGA